MTASAATVADPGPAPTGALGTLPGAAGAPAGVSADKEARRARAKARAANMRGRRAGAAGVAPAESSDDYLRGYRAGGGKVHQLPTRPHAAVAVPAPGAAPGAAPVAPLALTVDAARIKAAEVSIHAILYAGTDLYHLARLHPDDPHFGDSRARECAVHLAPVLAPYFQDDDWNKLIQVATACAIPVVHLSGWSGEVKAARAKRSRDTGPVSFAPAPVPEPTPPAAPPAAPEARP